MPVYLCSSVIVCLWTEQHNQQKYPFHGRSHGERRAAGMQMAMRSQFAVQTAGFQHSESVDLGFSIPRLHKLIKYCILGKQSFHHSLRVSARTLESLPKPLNSSSWTLPVSQMAKHITLCMSDWLTHASMA